MPRLHLTPGKDPVHIVQEAGWASGPLWTGAENLAQLGFDPRTVQHVGSRYTNYATRPTCTKYHETNLIFGHSSVPYKPETVQLKSSYTFSKI